MKWFVIHSTVSHGKTITLPRDPKFTVFASTEEKAIETVHAHGWDRLTGFKFAGVERAK